MASVESSSPHPFLASGNIWQIWTEPMGHGGRSGEVIWHRRVLFVGETLGIRSNKISILVQMVSWIQNHQNQNRQRLEDQNHPKSMLIYFGLVINDWFKPPIRRFSQPMWSPWMTSRRLISCSAASSWAAGNHLKQHHLGHGRWGKYPF